MKLVVTWRDVEREALTLPDAELGHAHEGSPAIIVHGRQFARLRLNDTGGAVLQFWVAEADLVHAYSHSEPEIYWGVPAFSKKVVLADLAALDQSTVRELLVESWACRAPVRLRKAHAGLR